MVDSVSRYEKASKLSSGDFKQLFGVKKETFEVMVNVLKIAYDAKHKRRGRHAKLSLEDQLFLTLKYNRQYLTQKELSYEFEIGEATTHDTIVWVENTLVKSGKFSLPGKKALYGDDTEIGVVLVDVTESPVERHKKTEKDTILVNRRDTHRKNN
ncbi:MAG: transposase family protein [Nitrososphaerota archaeon]|jgi:DNA-directed RNA polymerase alpha subunit|nr:transposase family protein [Nitrososphaerota archaeon]